MSALNEEKQAICGLVQIFTSSLKRVIKEYDQRTGKENAVIMYTNTVQLLEIFKYFFQ